MKSISGTFQDVGTDLTVGVETLARMVKLLRTDRRLASTWGIAQHHGRSEKWPHSAFHHSTSRFIYFPALYMEISGRALGLNDAGMSEKLFEKHET